MDCPTTSCQPTIPCTLCGMHPFQSLSVCQGTFSASHRRDSAWSLLMKSKTVSYLHFLFCINISFINIYICINFGAVLTKYGLKFYGADAGIGKGEGACTKVRAAPLKKIWVCAASATLYSYPMGWGVRPVRLTPWFPPGYELHISGRAFLLLVVCPQIKCSHLYKYNNLFNADWVFASTIQMWHAGVQKVVLYHLLSQIAIFIYTSSQN